MKIKIYVNKSLEQNAEDYFNTAKKVRKKIEGAKKTVEIYKKKLAELEAKRDKEFAALELRQKQKETRAERKQEWFHKFRWFFSSEGFLIVAGRDATTNEIIIKKHMDKEDIVFHTEMSGSPFAVIKRSSVPDKDIGQATLDETAIFCASFARAWKLGYPSLSVFYVLPEQVTKETKSGEYIQKGSFMIYGKKNFLSPNLLLAVCDTENGLMAAPISAAKVHAKGPIVLIVQGNDKPSAAAKQIKKKLNTEADLDEIIKVIPPGGCRIKEGNR